PPPPSPTLFPYTTLFRSWRMKPRSKHLACALLALLLGALGTAQADVPRIGVEDDWYPYSAVRQGEIRGLSVDIVRAAFAAAGVRSEEHTSELQSREKLVC